MKRYQIPDGYGVFVRNTSARYADRLVDGTKSIETRSARTLDSFIGKWVPIVRTETKEIIGEVFIGGVKQYANLNEFNADYEKHLVPVAGNRFAWNGKGTRYGYIITNHNKFDEPLPIAIDAKRYGRIAVRID